MKRLILICATMGLILGSASPPARGRVETPHRHARVALAVPAVRAAAAPALVVTPPAPAQRAVAPTPRPAVAAVGREVGAAVRVLVSLPQQRAWVFRGRELIGTSRVSTGRRGHPTPAGTFPILEKQIEHYSNLYDSAPMPYMQRLTLGGIALHGGHVPGYPASHGCIRLPHAFARRLYRLTVRGTPVTITRARLRSAGDALRLIT